MNEVYNQNAGFLQCMTNSITTVMSDEDRNNAERFRIEKRLAEIETARDELISLVTSGSVAEDSLDKDFENLNNEEKYLKTQLEAITVQQVKRDEVRYSIMSAFEELHELGEDMTRYNDVSVRKTIDCIRVLSKTEIQIIFKGGFEMNVPVEK